LQVLRVSNPHILTAVWRLVLIVSLLMPFLAGWATFPVPSAALPIRQVHQILATEPVIFLAPSLARGLPAVRSPIIDWHIVCSSIYFLVAAVLLLRLLIGAALTWKLCRSAVPVREDWTMGRDVRVSAAVNVPVIFGATILVPASYAGWDALERRAVMTHEYSHIRNGDFYFLILASINKAVFWFSPLAWWLSSRIAYLAEARSDAAAIEDIEDRVRYAEILLGFGSRTGRATTSLAMAGTKTVSLRVESLLAETMLPKEMNWKSWSVVVVCIIPLAAITVGAVAQMPSVTLERTASITPLPTPDQETLRQRQEDQKAPRQEVQIDPAILDNYVGYYQFGAYRVITVTREGDALFAEFSGGGYNQVYPESPQKFFYKVVAAQLAFVTDAQGRATGLVLHQDGLERPAPRIDQPQAQALQDNFAKRLKDGAPMPGSEAALRHQLEGFAHGMPDYDAMTESLAALKRPVVPIIQRQLALLGPLQSISFRGIGSSGWDLYEARFANGIFICRILLTPDGKITGLRFEWGP
jgi:beta-lactamase regulating signal transducer with metallopeptidase domain